MNMLQSDLFHGEEDLLRIAQEAVKHFVAQLDPSSDQIGFVPFGNEVRSLRVKLQCLRYAQTALDDPPKCYDPTTNPISYTAIIRSVELHNATGSTNIAEGVREGLEELGSGTGCNHRQVGSGHCCRRSVNHLHPDPYQSPALHLHQPAHH